MVDDKSLSKANGLNLDPALYLSNNDSYHFFEAINGLFKTGPTNTNVCDLHLLLVNGGS
jgi:hydroxypyruvate reductase